MFDWLRKIFPKKEAGLTPEKYYIVRIDEHNVACTTPQGQISNLAWDKLETVYIETNDTGPWSCDVWWLLKGDEALVVIPQGATGERELIDHLQRLPNFNNNAMIDAMCCTSNRRFLCWEKIGIPE